jgi:hypothetical protein
MKFVTGLFKFTVGVIVCGMLTVMLSQAFGAPPSAGLFSGVVAVVATLSFLTPQGVLGMNVYGMSFLTGMDGWDSGDAISKYKAKRACLALGYLWLLSEKSSMQYYHNAFVAQSPMLLLSFMTKYKVPQIPLPLTRDLVMAGPATIDMGGTQPHSHVMYQISTDSACNDMASNIDKPVVNAGQLVVIAADKEQFFDDELTGQIEIPFAISPGGTGEATQRFIIGIASTDQMQGVYERPFDGAIAFATFGSDEEITKRLKTAERAVIAPQTNLRLRG